MQCATRAGLIMYGKLVAYISESISSSSLCHSCASLPCVKPAWGPAGGSSHRGFKAVSCWPRTLPKKALGHSVADPPKDVAGGTLPLRGSLFGRVVSDIGTALGCKAHVGWSRVKALLV